MMSRRFVVRVVPGMMAVLGALPCLAADDKPAAADVVAPNANLVVDGVPPIPKSLAADVDRYTEFRGALFLDWHPTERQMLVATRFADTPPDWRARLGWLPAGSDLDLDTASARAGARP